MRKIVVMALAMLATVVVCLPVSAASGWTTPRSLSDAVLSQPSSVVDARGAVHIAARGTNGLWYLTNKSGHWTRVRLTRDQPHQEGTVTSGSPVIALDRWDGSLTVVYVVNDGTCCPGNISLAYVTDRHAGGPGTWSAPRSIPYGSATDPSLSVVVRHGVIAIAANTGVYDVTGVEFITNAGGRWTHEEIRASGQRWAGEPSLALDRQGRPVIAYQVHGGYPKADAIRLAIGTTTTGRFATARVVAMPGASDPSLALDAKGRPRFVFYGDGGTYEARRTASGWHTRLIWQGGHDSELRIGRGGHPRVVGVRETPTPRIWYAKWASGAWHRTRLTTHPTSQPTLAVGTSTTPDHVAYVLGGHVWYTHSK
jgi:hypothetical protein